jgi:hypothetical protein
MCYLPYHDIDLADRVFRRTKMSRSNYAACDRLGAGYILVFLQRLLQPFAIFLACIGDMYSDVVSELLRYLFQCQAGCFREVEVYNWKPSQPRVVTPTFPRNLLGMNTIHQQIITRKYFHPT